MKSIRRSWNKLPIGGRVEFMGKVIANQEKTPKILASDDPRLPAFKVKYLAAKAADDQVKDLEDQLKAARTARITAVDDAVALIDPNASFVEATATSEAQILAIGYELVADKTAVGPMGQVTELSVTPGDADGTLDWNCHPEPGASGYEPRTTTDPNNAALWQNHMVVTQSNGTLTGLPSGVRHYEQIRAIGPLGPGPWSDIAWRMVP